MKWGACVIIFALAFTAIGMIGVSSCDRAPDVEGPACHMTLWESPAPALGTDIGVPATASKITFVALAILAVVVSLVRPTPNVDTSIWRILHLAFDFAQRPTRSEAATLRPS